MTLATFDEMLLLRKRAHGISDEEAKRLKDRLVNLKEKFMIFFLEESIDERKRRLRILGGRHGIRAVEIVPWQDVTLNTD